MLLCLLSFAWLPMAAASTTPTEARAIAAAQQDHSAYTLPPEKLVKAEKLARFYDTLYFAGTAWGMVALWLMLQLGFAARMRDFAERRSGRRWVQGLVFVFEALLLITLLNLPLGMIAHHVSIGNGFSVQGWASWLGDRAKSFGLEFAVGSTFALLLYALMRRFPRQWWLGLWFPTMVIVLGGVYVTPYLIDPLFNTFEPLSKSQPGLVRQIERVAQHGGIDIPPERMFLMKASEKTTLMNAYVTGFGSSKRLVIWDTLLRKDSRDGIAFTAGHEMGHYVLGHVLRGVLISFAGILLAFFVGFHLFQWMLRRFGGRWGVRSQEDWAALVVILLVLNVLSFFAEPIGNAFSRSMEHDADVFGQEAIHGVVADPQAAARADFQMFGEASYDEPTPSAFVEFWTGSHPTTAFRAAFAKHYDPWAPGEEPKYFPK